MGLKEFVEKHPAAVATMLVVASVSAASAVIGYLYTRSIDAKQLPVILCEQSLAK